MPYLGNTNQLYSYQDPMVKEDMAPMLSIATPVDMPWWYLLDSETVNRRDPEWGVDKVARPTTVANIPTLARPEGKDAAFTDTLDLGFRLKNMCQIASRDVDITNTERATQQHGYEDAYRYQMWKKGLEVGIEFEMAFRWGRLVQGNNNQTGAGRVMHGIVGWAAELGIARSIPLATHTLNGSAASPAIPSDYFSTWFHSAGGADTELTRQRLYDNILNPAWQQGFNVIGAEAFLSTSLKRQIAYLNRVANGPINNREIPADRKMLVDSVSAIETDLGLVFFNIDRYFDLPPVGGVDQSQTYTVNAVANTIVCRKAILFWQRDYVKIGMLRRIYDKNLPDPGDSTKGMVVGEGTIQVTNPIMLCGGSNFVANAAA